MIESKTITNLLIDWKRGNKKSRESRNEYLQVLRKFLLELDALDNEQIKASFKKWDIYFIDTDEFHRVNIDEPK